MNNFIYYFGIILLTFYETFQDLSETRGGPILQNTSMVVSNTVLPTHVFTISTFIRRPKIHFRSTLNSAYKNNIFFRNYILLYIKVGLSRSIHLILHQPPLFRSENCMFIFCVIAIMNIFFFSRCDIITKQKKLRR